MVITTIAEEYRDIPKEARIADHLKMIDPVLVPLAGKLAKAPFKDLSRPENNYSRIEIEPKDLAAVRLTDFFPENGVVPVAAKFYPETLRFTVHTTINSLAPDIPLDLGGTTWSGRKYAILIPFEKIKDRVLAFNPADTFFLDDLVLPEGTVILKDKQEKLTLAAGKAQVIEADYSETGQKLTGIQLAVYKQMIEMGYFPQYSFPHGEWIGGKDSEWRRVWEGFCQKNGLEYAYGNPHASHWTGQMEDIAYWLDYNRRDRNRGGFIATVREAQELLTDEKIPVLYRNKVAELITNQGKNFPRIKLPKLIIS